MWANKYSVKEIFMGKGDENADLLNQLNQFCKENNIRSGMVSAIGAIKNLEVIAFNKTISYEGPLEIIACNGNVSIKNGEPHCHLHIAASDKSGKCFGGCLLQGTKIFVLEFVIYSFEGEEIIRGIDEKTKLSLWVKN